MYLRFSRYRSNTISSTMFVFVVLLLVVIACLSFILYGRKNYGILEQCGIPVVKPSLFLGSVPNFHSKVHQIEDIKRFKKYGPIWGVSDFKLTVTTFTCGLSLLCAGIRRTRSANSHCRSGTDSLDICERFRFFPRPKAIRLWVCGVQRNS